MDDSISWFVYPGISLFLMERHRVSQETRAETRKKQMGTHQPYLYTVPGVSKRDESWSLYKFDDSRRRRKKIKMEGSGDFTQLSLRGVNRSRGQVAPSGG